MAKIPAIKPEFLNAGKYVEGFGIVKILPNPTASDVEYLKKIGLSEVFEEEEKTPKKEKQNGEEN